MRFPLRDEMPGDTGGRASKYLVFAVSPFSLVSPVSQMAFDENVVGEIWIAGKKPR